MEYLHDEGVQSVAHVVGRVELGEHHGVRGRLAQVAHPELGSLEVRGVDDKLLQGREGKGAYLPRVLEKVGETCFHPDPAGGDDSYTLRVGDSNRGPFGNTRPPHP